MSEVRRKKKIDIEAKLFIYLLKLKEEKNKKYSFEECKVNVAYVFDNYNEFKSYFQLNGFPDINKDLLELCRMKTTKKGTIIALKKLCDYTIRQHNLISSQTINSPKEEKQQFEVLAVPCDRVFVIQTEELEELKKVESTLGFGQQPEEMAKEFEKNNLVRKRVMPNTKFNNILN